MNFKYKLHLLELNVDILYNDEQRSPNVKGVREVSVVSDNNVFTMLFDERFNEIDFVYNNNPDDPFKYSNKISEYLTKKHKEILNSDFRYKRGDGFDNSKTIYLEDFIKHLKVENRESVINSILD